MTTKVSDEDLAREFARASTEKIAPEEAPYFDEILNAAASSPAAQRDRSLAFGISPDSVVAALLFEVGKAVVTAIWTAAQPMLAGVAQDAANELRVHISQKIKDWIGARFATPLQLKLDPDGKDKLLAAVESAAAQQGLPVEQVGKLKDMISKGLATA